MTKLKKFQIGAALLAVLSVMFLMGVFTQTVALLMPAFCLWSPALAWTAYQWGRAGKVAFRNPVQFEADEA